jgi:hypothetical protein
MYPKGLREKCQSAARYDYGLLTRIWGVEPNTLSGDAEAPVEGCVSVRKVVRDINSTEEALGGLPGYRVVTGRE